MEGSIAARLKRVVFEDREIPEVGAVRVRRLTAGEIHDLAKMTDGRESTAWTIRTCVVDEAGNPVYASDDEVWATDQQVLKALNDVVVIHNDEQKGENYGNP